MNIMLYIVIGLVVIALIAIVVMRNNKAKKAPNLPLDQTAKRSIIKDDTVKRVPTESQAPVQEAAEPDTLVIAQRFMDQQRYDKAIETLEHGLVKQPRDSKLSLRLLNLYAITDQYDSFNNLYDSIQTSGDAATIDEADQLKTLLEQEQSQSQPTPANIDNTRHSDTGSDFDSLDFDLSDTNTATETKPTQAIATDSLELPNQSEGLELENLESLDSESLDLESLDLENLESSAYQESHSDPVLADGLSENSDFSSETSSRLNDDNHFDLTLDDLEAADLESSALEPTTSDTSNEFAEVLEDKVLETETMATEEQPTASSNIDDDFTLDFDSLLEDDSASDDTTLEALSDESLSNDTAQNINLDDDFVLDFAELNEQPEPTAESNIDEDFTLPQTVNLDDDLSIEDTSTDVLGTEVETLSFDDEKSSDEAPVNDELEPDVTTSALATDAPVTDTSVDSEDQFAFVDITDNPSVDGSSSENPSFEHTGLDTQDLNDQQVELRHQDEAQTADEGQQQSAEVPAVDFAAQFATDFDFVDTLDSSQVTLDLAGQYLELGEYDSAKRLLNEVIADGNHEQQNQAQALLARTA